MSQIPFSAILLAGGKSSRMGQDKALLKFGEKTMVEHLVGLMAPIFEEIFVVVDRKAKLEGLDLRESEICEDLIKERGPLAGIYTGLCYSKTQASCVFTCDMPWIDQPLIENLIGFWEKDYDVTCLEDDEEKIQPFPGIYGRQCRSLMRIMLDRGEASLHRFLDVVNVKPLVLEKEKIKVLTNMNTIEDYYRVLREKKEGVKE